MNRVNTKDPAWMIYNHYFYGPDACSLKYVDPDRIDEYLDRGYQIITMPEDIQKFLKEKEEYNKEVPLIDDTKDSKEFRIVENDSNEFNEKFINKRILKLKDQIVFGIVYQYSNWEIHEDFDEDFVSLIFFRYGKNFVKIYKDKDEILQDLGFLKKVIGSLDSFNKLEELLKIII